MKRLILLVLAISLCSVSAFGQQEKTELSKLRVVPARSISEAPAPETASAKDEKTSTPFLPRKKTRLVRNKQNESSTGNLPTYALRTSLAEIETQEGSIVINKNAKYPTSVQLRMGDILHAKIYQDLIGYEGAQSPVRAIVTDGQYKGAMLIGNASLDKKTKNVLVSFTNIRTTDGEYQLSATLHSVTGELGLKGQFSSNYWQYFWANVLANGVSGYANALTERRRGILGFSEIVPTPDAAVHQAVAGAASETANLFAERAKEAPEYSVVEGPIKVSVFITKEPTNL